MWWRRSVVQTGLYTGLWLVKTFAHLQDTRAPFHTAVHQEETWSRFTVGQLVSEPRVCRPMTPADGQIFVVWIEGEGCSLVCVITGDLLCRVNVDISSWCISQRKWRLLKIREKTFKQRSLLHRKSPGASVHLLEDSRRRVLWRGLNVELTWSCCPTRL